MAATTRSAASLDALVAAYGDAVLPLEMDVTDKAAIYDGLRRRITAFAGKQPAGDPAAAAQALLKTVDSDNPPLRILFGQGFYPMPQQVYADRLKPGPTGRTSRRRLTATSIKKIGDPGPSQLTTSKRTDRSNT